MRKKILMILSILFGLNFINAGLNKFLNYMPIPEDMPENLMKVTNAIMEFGWLYPLIGIVEIVGGILFMFTKTRALGAIVILPVVVGITLTHIVNVPSGLPIALLILAINIWVIIENWQRYLPMIKSGE